MAYAGRMITRIRGEGPTGPGTSLLLGERASCGYVFLLSIRVIGFMRNIVFP